MLKLHLNHKALYIVLQRVHVKQGTVNQPNSCFDTLKGRVIHPVSTTNIYVSSTFAKHHLTPK